MDIMAEATKKLSKTLSEEVRKRNREGNRARDKTTVSLRLAFTRWRELKHLYDLYSRQWCKSELQSTTLAGTQ